MAPFKNNQNLFVFKDDYSSVMGQALPQGRHRLQLQPEERGRVRPGVGRVVAVRRRGRSDRRTATRRATSSPICCCEAWRSISARPRPSDRSSSAGATWRRYALGLLEDAPRVTIDYGLRWSRFENPFDVGDTISSFDPSAFVPALGADACNGMLLPPGSTACTDAGSLAAEDGPNRSLAKTQQLLRATAGRRLGRLRQRQDIVRAGVGQFYQRESLQNGLNLGFNPPFNRALLGSRTLDSDAEPFPDAFATTTGIPQSVSIRPERWATTGSATCRCGRELRTTRRSRSAMSAASAAGCCGRTTSTSVPPANRLAYIHAGSDSDARRGAAGRTGCSATRTSQSRAQR